jgi:hypothetical protein
MLNRKELFHRNLPDENIERNSQEQPRPENGELPVVEHSGSNNNNNIGIPNRSSNQITNNLQRGHSSHANRRTAPANKTVKRVQGKALAIMNEVKLIPKFIIISHY